MTNPRLPPPVKALCEDGVTRTATPTAQADTFFSIPARISIKGKSIKGFLTIDGEQWEFTAESGDKNAHLVKQPQK